MATNSAGETDSTLRVRATWAALEVGVIVAIVVAGRVSHDETILGEPLGTLLVALPFALAWGVVTGLTDRYARLPTAVGPAVTRTGIAWLAASNLGFLARGSPFLPGDVPWSFTVVFTGMGFVGLVGLAVLGATFAGRVSTTAT